jgi:glycosyltransferase involved in cell wall biosynthesis
MTADAVGGVWTYAVGLCEALPETEFVLATCGPRPTHAQLQSLARLPNVTLRASDWRLEWMPGSDADVRSSCDWLRELAAQERPDVLHVNGYAHAAVKWQLPVLVVAHSCVLSWWRAVHETEAPQEWSSYRARVAAALRLASQVVVPTRAFLRELRLVYGAATAAQVIHNGLSFDAVTCRQATSSARYDFIIGAGRAWDAAKNLQALDDAAAELEWPVCIAGPAREPEGESTGEATALARHALCLGELPREELGQLLGRAAIFASPAVYEPFGLTILEAAAAECALVLGDIPTLRELWDGAALFVPPREPRRLASALRRLVEEPAVRASLARAGAARARQFPVRRTAASYRQLYERLRGRLPAAAARVEKRAHA